MSHVGTFRTWLDVMQRGRTLVGSRRNFVVNPLLAWSYFGPGSGSHPHWGWDAVC
jgi:hypothetical protein